MPNLRAQAASPRIWRANSTSSRKTASCWSTRRSHRMMLMIASLTHCSRRPYTARTVIWINIIQWAPRSAIPCTPAARTHSSNLAKVPIVVKSSSHQTEIFYTAQSAAAPRNNCIGRTSRINYNCCRAHPRSSHGRSLSKISSLRKVWPFHSRTLKREVLIEHQLRERQRVSKPFWKLDTSGAKNSYFKRLCELGCVQMMLVARELKREDVRVGIALISGDLCYVI